MSEILYYAVMTFVLLLAFVAPLCIIVLGVVDIFRSER